MHSRVDLDPLRLAGITHSVPQAVRYHAGAACTNHACIPSPRAYLLVRLCSWIALRLSRQQCFDLFGVRDEGGGG